MKANKTATRVREIISQEAAAAGITSEDILSVARRYWVPRWRAVWRAKKETGFSYRRLAPLFNRHDNSLYHVVSSVDKLLAAKRAAEAQI